MRRRMAASLNRPTAWRRRGVARTAFPEPRSWPRTVHGSGAAARPARGRADAAARAARRRRGALATARFLLELSHSAVRGILSVQRARVFARTPARRAPGAVAPAGAPYRHDESRAPGQERPENRRNRPNPDGRARGPAKPRAARRDRDGFPRFLDGSTALGAAVAAGAARRRAARGVARRRAASRRLRGSQPTWTSPSCAPTSPALSRHQARSSPPRFACCR